MPLGVGAGMAIGGIAGGLLNFAGTERANRANQQSYKNRIQWTVADAKKAGVHPLFALGGSGAGVPPTAIAHRLGDVANNLGKAYEARTAAAAAEKLNEQQIKESDSRIKLNEVQAGLVSSQIAREMQSFYSGGNDFYGLMNPAVEYQPDQVTRSAPGKPQLTAGKHPGWQRIRVGPGENDFIYAPSKETADMWESAAPIMYPQAIAKGGKWLWDQFIKLQKRGSRITWKQLKDWFNSERR